MRVDNWASQLDSVVKEIVQKDKFEYGKNDCITFTLKCIETITGKKVFDYKWKSLKDGKEIIKKLKQKDLLGIALHIAKENNFPLINTNKVQRGDVLYYKDEFDWDGTLGVCLGPHSMFNWKKGINLIENNKCKFAWRIK